MESTSVRNTKSDFWSFNNKFELKTNVFKAFEFALVFFKLLILKVRLPLHHLYLIMFRKPLMNGIGCLN